MTKPPAESQAAAIWELARNVEYAGRQLSWLARGFWFWIILFLIILFLGPGVLATFLPIIRGIFS